MTTAIRTAKIVLFTLLGALSFLEARAGEGLGFKVEPITLIENGVEIHGVRFLNVDGHANVNGEPLLLTHGLSSNRHEFEAMVPDLLKANKDVFAFNWRFHGNEAERSVDRNFREGDEIFNRMAQIDLPMMLKHVQTIRPGKKIQLIGHSMGGMVPRAALILGTVSPEILDRMVLIGSPAKFSGRKASPIEEFGVKPVLRMHLYSGRSLDPVFRKSDRRWVESTADVLNVLNPVYWYFKDAIRTELKNRSRAEMGPVVDEPNYEVRADAMISDLLPKKILREFDQFSRRYDYENVPIPGVRILHIAGEKDNLAPWRDIYEGARVQSAEPGFWFVLVRGIGHFGIVSKWAISEYARTMFNFLQDPDSIGLKNETFLEIEPNRGNQAQCRALFAGA